MVTELCEYLILGKESEKSLRETANIGLLKRQWIAEYFFLTPFPHQSFQHPSAFCAFHIFSVSSHLLNSSQHHHHPERSNHLVNVVHMISVALQSKGNGSQGLAHARSVFRSSHAFSLLQPDGNSFVV